ncbi:unnamed protein product [Spirodela intermedia]|uniref:K Homology domain-containing protein n=1 Tax=Spirodela intermedia TaxID=51605 RepID=A0A7I8JKX5_SPIIN|nr:unnamed protein product [Spirodela intermedia]CAA6670132.1 unnamed protein product [Spirodela intermedia]
MGYSPSRSPSTAPQSHHISGMRAASAALVEQEKYLSELLAERKKLNPFIQVLPHCSGLLNQEILRVTILLGNGPLLDQSGLDLGSSQSSGGLFSNGQAGDVNGWSPFQSERLGLLQSPSWNGWSGAQGTSSALIVKKTIRVDVPLTDIPWFYNFVGRLLGPRGNSLKRVEAITECRILIRGRGSIKDPAREEMMRGKPGYEHLNESLHILVEAELPAEIVDARLMQAREVLEELLKPMDETRSFKKHQLRELALLNGTLREEGSSGPSSPFHDSLGLKRAKTRS